MNNKLQLFVVSFLSLATGVLGTLIFQSSQKSVELIHSAEIKKEEKRSEVVQERRPFFIKSEAPVTDATSSSSEAENSPQNATEKRVDYFTLAKQVSEVQSKVYEEIAKKYKILSHTNPRYKESIEMLSGRLNYFFDEKKTWFKSVVDLTEAGGTRLYFFMNYYSCGVEKDKKILPKNACYIAWIFFKYKGKWQYFSTSSSADSYSWKDDRPYVILNLEHVGDFARDHRLLSALLPVPEEDESLQLVRYENEKLSWIDGGRLTWQVSSEKEAKKFQKSINDFTINQANRSSGQ